MLVTQGSNILACKAAESRHLMSAMLHVLRKHSDGSPKFLHMILAYEHMQSMDTICMESGLVLSDDDSTGVLRICELFLKHDTWLTLYCAGDEGMSFKFLPKHHMLWHIAYFARCLSPRASWCYAFKDFVGRIQRSAKACVSGTAMHKVPGKVVENYMLALLLMLNSHAE